MNYQVHIDSLNNLSSIQQTSKRKDIPSNQFSGLLKSSLEQLNQLQVTSDVKTEQFITGEVEDLHQVMIAAEKATIALEMGVQIQRKMIEAYQEIMRMQV